MLCLGPEARRYDKTTTMMMLVALRLMPVLQTVREQCGMLQNFS